MMNNYSPNILLPHGGYHKLVTYRLGNLIYDATAAFCAFYLNIKDRTYDQMVQAARSGVANIIEGSEAGATSKKMELKLTNTAKSSQEELLSDYLTFLRQHNLPKWNANSQESLLIRRSRPADLTDLRRVMAAVVRILSDKSDRSDRFDKAAHVRLLQEVACNTMITLINQETYLLKRQIIRLAKDFENNGGFTERMYRIRKERRLEQVSDQSDRSDNISEHSTHFNINNNKQKGDSLTQDFYPDTVHGARRTADCLTYKTEKRKLTKRKFELCLI